MLTVRSMEGLGRIMEEDSVSLAATRYDAAWRERVLAPDLTGNPGAAVPTTKHSAAAPQPEPLDLLARGWPRA